MLKLQTLSAGLMLALCTSASAQVYQCTKNGSVSFQEAPCEKDSTAKTLAIRNSGSSGIFTAGLKTGMSIDEVKSKVAGTQAINSDRLFNGSVGKLGINPVNMAGGTFSAKFFFLGDRFFQVNLSSDMTRNAENLKLFDKLCAELRSVYGPESSHKVDNKPTMLSADAEWSTASYWAFVSITPVTADTSLLTLGLRPGGK
ncbi:DUF4124 domain-containing protein [Chitinimonas sp.]|uniref:DUF4124 domain-containing protein n=1 Tax=Chitinimonas sp. TaxID=1934313 RepID=UPI0035B00D12